MIDLNHINIGDEVIIRLPSGSKVLGEVGSKVLGEVGGEGDVRFVIESSGAIITDFARLEQGQWVPLDCTVIGHIPSMFGGDW